METLFEEIKDVKEKHKSTFDNIKYARNKNKLKKTDSPLFKSKIVEITSKQQIYEEMKSRFRSNWKSTHLVPPLPTKPLFFFFRSSIY